MNIGQNIKTLRTQAGLTQEQLAEQVDCSVAFIGQVEAPKVKKAISLDMLFNIARVLNVPAYKFLEFND